MTQLEKVLGLSAPPPAGGGRGVIRWLCTSNPFYVISAALFFAGLWISFGDQAQEEDTWALMTGLGGYTLLLAVVACVLVRFGNVWDDVRTVLLLVVLMFLATSVTFDDVLYADPRLGAACYLVGLAWAVLISEGILRITRLALPALFRVPYYLILGLFFLYPVAISPLIEQPRSELLMWALFGFSPAAGLAFLTLLPAIRRGPAYVLHNGSPWRWPLYPWVLFGALALVVPGRAYFLCWLMHPVAFADVDLLIFGPYFLVPFGFSISLLLLEIGIVANHRGVLRTALFAPAALAVLAMSGHHSESIFCEFLSIFSSRLGGSPLFLTLLGSLAFYLYALYRRVPEAVEGLTPVLVALAVVAPQTITLKEAASLQPGAILAAAVVQLTLGIPRRSSWHCLLAGIGLVVLAAVVFPSTPPAVEALRGLIIYHLLLGTALTIGIIFDDPLAQFLRTAGAIFLLLGCLAISVIPLTRPQTFPSWLVLVYPPIVAGFLAGYGLAAGKRATLGSAGLISALWLVSAGWRGYRALRVLLAGFDYLILGLGLLVLAIVISLVKSAARARWIAARQDKATTS